MTTEIVRHESPATLPEKMEWARALATSNLLPRQYQNNPGNLLFAVEYADALGVSRINAITSIHVIEGKPSASADLIASLVRRAGHKLRVSGDDQHAVAQLIRADDPEFTYEARWDLAKARAAGLLGKGVWKSYPGAMLRSRAITEVARMGASDALFGVIYTPEELGQEVDDDGTVVHNVTTAPQASSGADRVRQAVRSAPVAAASAPAPASAPEEPAMEDAPVDGITSAQLKKMGAGMRELGMTERQLALDFVESVIGRAVSSRNDLTKDEASRVIDELERTLAGREDVVEGEIVPDGEVGGSNADLPADTGDADAVWAEILRVADEQGMTLGDVEDHFSQEMGGMVSAEASAAELQSYLNKLRSAVPA